MSLSTVHANAMYLTHRHAETAGGQTPLAATVTAGAPATFSSSVVPTNLTELLEYSGTEVLGDSTPGTDWGGAGGAAGDHVLLADGSHYYWNGTTWVEGDAP